jgi:hypothetical protein
MELLRSEPLQAFSERHRIIDWLRGRRESGDPFAVETGTVQALLQEVDLLQVVAQAAEHVAAFPCGEGSEEPLTNLRNSLTRWKE